MTKVLVVDDEAAIVKGIKFSLEHDDYEVDCAYDGREALEKIRANDYDIVLLDLMLPVMDGYEVCQQVREFSDVPIIMLTAKSSDIDKITGLDYGADDYVTKPFNNLEVKARIKAILRRSRSAAPQPAPAPEEIRVGALFMNLESRRIFIGEKEIRLTAKEFDILELLLKNPGKVFSREELLSVIWGENRLGDVRTVDVHVRRLREKIETNPSDPQYVYTKWGRGYFFKG